MSGEVNFNPNKMSNARFINARMQPEKADAMTGAGNSVLQSLQQNSTEFVTKSARSLYQFFANMQSLQMQGTELSLVLKDLLNMNKDMETFLAMLTDKTAQGAMNKSDLAKLLLNSQTNLTQLKLFMHENGKEALAKLFNITADYAQSGAVARSSQMSEIIAILNACTPNADTSQVQILKNMMLLYLPWLPLGEQNFTLEIGGGKDGGEEGGNGEDSITVMISTVNFGNVHVLIYKEDKSSVNFNISAGEKFPKEEVLKELKAEAKEYNVQTSMVFEKKENLTKKNPEQKTEVTVNTSNKINPFLILMAQATVKIIINLDKNKSLLNSRREKL